MPFFIVWLIDGWMDGWSCCVVLYCWPFKSKRSSQGFYSSVLICLRRWWIRKKYNSKADEDITRGRLQWNVSCPSCLMDGWIIVGCFFEFGFYQIWVGLSFREKKQKVEEIKKNIKDSITVRGVFFPPLLVLNFWLPVLPLFCSWVNCKLLLDSSIGGFLFHGKTGCLNSALLKWNDFVILLVFVKVKQREDWMQIGIEITLNILSC